MVPNNVLFITYPAVSHYISILPKSLEHKQKGHQVYFTGIEKERQLIRQSGLNFVPINYYESFYLVNCKMILYLLFASQRPMFLKKRYKKLLELNNEINRYILKLNITTIYLDAHLSIYYSFLPSQIKVYIFNTKLSTLRSPSCPPLSSGVVFKKNLLYFLLGELMWVNISFRHFCLVLLQKMVFLGKDDEFLFRIFLKRNGRNFNNYFLPFHKCWLYYELNFDKVNIPIYIVGSQTIEYNWKILHKNEIYLNLNTLIHLHDRDNWKSLYRFIDHFYEVSKISNIKLIYCSLGTMVNRKMNKAIVFLKKIINCLKNDERFMLIVSTGGLDTSMFPNSANIFIEKLLPQHNILQYCDMMITHGGMNSVKECLHYKVPMLVYPLSLEFDQPGNAARVVHCKLGVQGNIAKDKGIDILNKVERALLIPKSNFVTHT